MKKTKILHIIIIVLGIIFILLPAFHSSIWFDESYSVAIAKYGFSDIWNITAHDVHPAFYYWGLHIVYLIFGNNLIALKLFSVLGIAILGILGYTHIRKDFGEEIGILFSFLTYFLPTMSTYASEIRMYSWSALLVTLMSIYGYRFYMEVKERKEVKLKNLILFGIFSICSCYTHYYALATAGLINFIIFIYLIINLIKTNNKKEIEAEKETKTEIKTETENRTEKENEKLKENYTIEENKLIARKTFINFLIVALVQVLLYIPWIICMLGQVNHVKSGFWITIEPLKTTVEILSFQFRRQLDNTFEMNIHTIIALIASILMYIYVGIKIYISKKEKQNINVGIISILIYAGVIIIVYILSKLVAPILFARYVLVMTGLYIFALAYYINLEKIKYIRYGICFVVLILGIISNIENIQTNYSKTNFEPIKYIQSEIKKDDILVYSEIQNMGVMAIYFPENDHYFLNFEKWTTEGAYSVYGKGINLVENYDFLKKYKGRIWIVDIEDEWIYKDKDFPKKDIKILKKTNRFDTKYHEYIYNIMLVEKE